VIEAQDRNADTTVEVEFAADSSSGGRYSSCPWKRAHMISVLFVSHDHDLRAVAARVLRMAGCRVTTAGHRGHALLACMQGPQFDVMVVEDQQADGSAADAVERLRRYCPETPVVWMTDDDPEPTGGLVLVRPFTCDDLIGAVSDATHYTRRRTITL
jgi:CheY-like chemotaxis protein